MQLRKNFFFPAAVTALALLLYSVATAQSTTTGGGQGTSTTTAPGSTDTSDTQSSTNTNTSTSSQTDDSDGSPSSTSADNSTDDTSTSTDTTTSTDSSATSDSDDDDSASAGTSTGTSTSSDDSSDTPRTTRQSTTSSSRAGSQTPRRPSNADIPGRATGRRENQDLPGRAFDQDSDDDDQSATGNSSTRTRSRTSAQSGQSSTSTSNRTRLSTQGLDSDSDSSDDQDRVGSDSDHHSPDSSSATTTQSRSRTRQGRSGSDVSTRTRSEFDPTSTDDDSDSDDSESGAGTNTPRRPANADIPGRATGRRDNDQLPGRAFNRDDDQDPSDRFRGGHDQDDDQDQDQAHQDMDDHDQQSPTRRQTGEDRDSASTDQQRRQSRSSRTRGSQSDSDIDADVDADAHAEADVDSDVNVDTDIDNNITNNLGVQFSNDSQDRLTISSIQRNSVLAQAGLRRGDVLLSVSGQPISSMADFRDVVLNADGDRIPLMVLRDGRQQRIFVDAEQFVSLQSTSSSRMLPGLGLRVDQSIPDQLVISSIAPSSFLVRSGLRPGDIVTMVAGRPVSSIRDFSRILLAVDPGQRVPVIVMRDDREVTLYVANQQTQRYDQVGSGRAWLGVYFDTRYDNNAVVESVHPNSPADHAGIRPGDIIVSANGRRVRSSDQLTQIVSNLQPGEQLDLEVARRVTQDLQATLEERPEETYTGARDEGYDQSYRDGSYQEMDSDTGEYNDNYEVNTRRGDVRIDDERGVLDTGDRDGRVLNRDEGPRGILRRGR